MIDSFGTLPFPIQVPDRAVYRHESGEWRTVMEYEPWDKAADEIQQLYTLACRLVGLSTAKDRTARKRTAA